MLTFTIANDVPPFLYDCGINNFDAVTRILVLIVGKKNNLKL